MNYEDDLNCMFVAIKNNKGVGMTLREIAEREGVSHVQVFHDEKRALQKVRDSRGIEDVL
jgi:DNA-directed RNA polymerase specialized sigma subunit